MDSKARFLNKLITAAASVRPFLDNIPDEYADTPVEVLHAWHSEYKADLQRAKAPNEELTVIKGLLGLQAIIAARTMRSILDRIEGIEDRWTLASDAFSFGYQKGFFDARLTLGDPGFERIYQSLCGSKNVSKRWELDRQDYELAEQEAVVYYKEGGTDTHEKVAKRLARKYNVSQNTLRDKIKPIAREYGKVRGEKKSI